MARIQVGLADDHPVLRCGIEAIINVDDIEVAWSCGNADDALKLQDGSKADVIIMDISMPGDVIRAISRIATASDSGTKVLAFTAVTGVDYAIAALEAGAAGYVLKGSTVEELRDAIRSVNAGESYISPSFAAEVITGMRTASLRRKTRQACKFSVREEQVLRLLMQGQTNKEIADVLAISDKTVKHHMTIIMQKMHVRNRIEVVLAAQQMGLSADIEPARIRH